MRARAYGRGLARLVGSAVVLAETLLIAACAYLCAQAAAQHRAGPAPQRPVVAAPTVVSASDQAAADPASLPEPDVDTPPSDPGVRQFYENLKFWAPRTKPETVIARLGQLIAMAPSDPEVLAYGASLSQQMRRTALADRFRTRLEAVAPNDPRTLAVVAERKLGPDIQARLAEARRLAADDKQVEAVAAYKAVLGDTIPDSLAAEYYITLAGTSEDGFAEADRALSAVADRWPQDPSFRLALGKMRTYNENTRSDGIDLLQSLISVPEVTDAARKAWHDALLWQAGGKEALTRIDTYLSLYPPDDALAAKRQEVQDSLPDEALLARMRGYNAGNEGNAEKAEAAFLDALKHDPDDAESMIMLANIRIRQHRYDEGEAFVSRALTLAPDRKEEFYEALGYTPQNAPNFASPGWSRPRSYVTVRAGIGAGAGAGAGNDGGAAAYARIGALVRTSRFDEAERLLLSLMGHRGTAGQYLQLGSIQQGAGRAADAEKSFRQAVQREPQNADALLALARLLANGPNTDEADRLLTQARQAYQRQRNSRGLQAANAVQALRLRAQAQQAGTADQRVPMYRAALQLDPSSPWLRLDLAGALHEQGRTANAKQVIVDGLAAATPHNDAVKAAIVFADRIGDLPAANRLIEQLPAAERTPQMVADQDRLALREQLRQLVGPGASDQARQQVLVLVARPDPTGIRGQEIGTALMAVRDPVTARSALVTGLAGNGKPTTQQRLTYSGLLLSASGTQEARSALDGVQESTLTAQERQQYASIRNGIVIQQADKDVAAGTPANGLRQLRERLAQDPTNINLNLAVGRVLQNTGDYAAARALFASLLSAHPGHLDVILGAIYVEMAAKRNETARGLIAYGLQQFPDEPRLYVCAANLARSDGDNKQALIQLRHARNLREKQLAAGG